MNRLRARDVMTHPVVTVHPEMPIRDVIRTMIERRISGVPIVDRVGHLVGIVTEGDVLLKEAGPGGVPLLGYMGAPFNRTTTTEALDRSHGATAGDVMSTDVICAHDATPVKEIACLMARNGVNRIPIVKNRHVLGIVTRADILKVFDRPDSTLLAAVRRTLLEDLRIDPDRLDVSVQRGVAYISGTVTDPRDISLIETFVAEIDGLAGLDTSALSAGLVAS